MTEGTTTASTITVTGPVTESVISRICLHQSPCHGRGLCAVFDALLGSRAYAYEKLAESKRPLRLHANGGGAGPARALCVNGQSAPFLYVNDYVKHLFIRTPLERPLSWVRGLLGFRWRSKHPELREIFAEPARIEEVVRRIVRESSNCIDIGCHLGSMLNLMLTLAPKGRHMAFEAMPRKAEWLKRKFPEVDVRAVALSDRAGEVTFYENVKKTGFSGLRPHADPGDRLKEIIVPCDRLDAMVPEGHRVDFIKLDVEGAELCVLRGGEDLLGQQRPPILFECTRSGLTQFEITARDMYDYLTETLPYRVYLLKSWLNGGAPLDLGEFERAMVYPFQAFNFLAAPRD